MFHLNDLKQVERPKLISGSESMFLNLHPRFMNVIPWICQTLPLIHGHTQLIVKHSWLLINTKSPLAYLWSPCRIPPAIHHCRATQVATLQFFSERFTFICLLFSFAFVCLHNCFQRKRLQNCSFPFVSVFTKLCLFDQLSVCFYICLQWSINLSWCGTVNLLSEAPHSSRVIALNPTARTYFSATFPLPEAGENSETCQSCWSSGEPLTA